MARRKNARRTIQKKLMFMACGLVLLAGFTNRVILPPSREPQQLALLPEPTTSQVHLPGVLTLESIESSVLGAQPIEPDDIVKWINIERETHGAPPLIINQKLADAAQMRADVIMKYENFSHQDPHEGVELLTVLPMVDYQYKYATENIGMGGVSGKDFVQGFMSSTLHRENLLNPQLKETGVAVISGPYDRYYVNVAVQLFADPARDPEEYLGYDEVDRDTYEALLSDIEREIDITRKHLRWKEDERPYYESWLALLEQQRDHISSVYIRMRTGEPLLEEFIARIREYNTNWELLPQTQASE